MKFTKLSEESSSNPRAEAEASRIIGLIFAKSKTGLALAGGFKKGKNYFETNGTINSGNNALAFAVMEPTVEIKVGGVSDEWIESLLEAVKKPSTTNRGTLRFNIQYRLRDGGSNGFNLNVPI